MGLPKVLVTGFGPFRKFTHNPSGEVAEKLNGRCLGNNWCFDGIKLPVTDEGVKVVETALLSGNPKEWRVIIHLGLEDVAKGLKLEVAALNNRASDNSTVKDDGPTILPTTVDLGQMHLKSFQGLEDAQEIWSRDAGHYYCNEIFYRTLLAVRTLQSGYDGNGHENKESKGKRLLPVLFIHLPEVDILSLDQMAQMVYDVAELMTDSVFFKQ